MKILVTGANGYIGSHVVDYLISHYDVDVIACDLFLDHINDKAKKIALNILDPNVLSEENLYKRLGEPDVVIHLAWKDGFVHNSIAHIENLYNHYSFIKSMMVNKINSISVMGTMHEIGYHEGIVRNDTPCNPMSLYGIAKNALREMLLNVNTNYVTKIKWLRAYYIYGDFLRGASIFSKIAKAYQDGQNQFAMTEAQNMYDFITVSELAEQICAVSLQNRYNGIINVCSGKPVRLRDQIEKFLTDNNIKIQLNYGAYPSRSYDSPIIYGDATLVNEILAQKSINNNQ